MEYDGLFAERTMGIGTSAIREILKVVSKPGMVSLAGGIPAPSSFPIEIIKDLTQQVFETYGSAAFQYDLTEGFPPLRDALSGYLKKHRGIVAAADEILVASGSQGILDAVGKVFIGRGDFVAVEAPTYLGALQAFNPYEPNYIRLETDDNGLIPEALESALERWPLKFIYLVPSFQNPSGRTLSYDRRIEVARILKDRNSFLVEDDPYSLLRYRGEDIPPIKTLAPENVLYINTLSKVFAPGLRIGFCVAPEPVRKWLVIVKQGVDLHTSTLNQALAAEYLDGGYLDRHLPRILDIYGPRQEAMLKALDRYFPGRFKWSKPEGGMFLWAEGPNGLDMEKVYWKAISKNVAFVPGKFFYTDSNEGAETMRLNYTMADEPTIDRAVRILADVLCQEMRRL